MNWQPNPTKWYSPRQLARHWSVHVETILREIRAGNLIALRINRRVYRISEIDAAAFYATRCAMVRDKKLARVGNMDAL
jgi:hypothetical protein